MSPHISRILTAVGSRVGPFFYVVLFFQAVCFVVYLAWYVLWQLPKTSAHAYMAVSAKRRPRRREKFHFFDRQLESEGARRRRATASCGRLQFLLFARRPPPQPSESGHETLQLRGLRRREGPPEPRRGPSRAAGLPRQPHPGGPAQVSLQREQTTSARQNAAGRPFSSPATRRAAPRRPSRASGARARLAVRRFSPGLVGALGGADQRPAPRAPGQNQRPAPRVPERPRSRLDHPRVTRLTYFAQG